MKTDLSPWGLTLGRIRDDILLPGSPERCASRVAVDDSTGRTWMLEQLKPGQFDSRERIGRALTTLSDAGVPVPAYVAADGRYCVEQGGAYWQLSPFIFGDPLPQPEFVDDAARGVSLGQFIAGMRFVSSAASDEFLNVPRFDLEAYVNELMAVMAPRRVDLHEALLPVLGVLAPLFDVWHDLPVALCQGDFHPLNVIWNDTQVGAVIDWEFMGLRPVLFDVANCLGCVGIEDPHALVRGLAPALLKTLRDQGQLDPADLALLPEMILGMRFAWMSEWLRKQDEEMAQLEVRYMRLLGNSIDTLLPVWEQMLGMKG
ncbi:Aminoglycoside phosphotransferase [Pseudodesulfovibrio profundus]|uniref:Aminoglycoside phosphotransferase n=1 Tax=Pseudodesulfovibrio profundus TaxID=57320 RepID=A0A2C8F7X4_9BACT|nr:phosphotransferase [Pseudodesulfovibrio profundus]SOB58495.1 Aminoglycoside phosphotransferase [Pseudodesulfovibrio profundus]